MTDDPKERGRQFAAHLASFSQEQIRNQNIEDQKRADQANEDFRYHFRNGRCNLCYQALSEFRVSEPCLHWLLRPVGFTKRHFLDVASRFDLLHLEAWLRAVANEDGFGANINDYREEGSGKLIEFTIRYKTYEWSVSCGESDYHGHASASESSRLPHYHFQMRVNRQAFIRFNDFHVPLSEYDIVMLEASRTAPNLMTLRSSTPGMGDLLSDAALPFIVEHSEPTDDFENATFHLQTILIANEGTTISGDALAEVVKEAKDKGVTVASLMHKLPNVRMETHISPAPGVIEQAVRSGRGKKPRAE